ncbi:hypothetical protein LTR84_004371 [Exophiala bonariae]|uniref:Complex 1 LYR protein domain-containing protein n=1 Tax=Exophiala bonariae TaxID=1690606 RepID=A0AAV9N4I0_9EURO|nr:hypothetical protein LTR84_004371 [Exophiala bonariae]
MGPAIAETMSSSNLTFINLSGSTSQMIGKDNDTKSRVRSQVMKNVRRKQRLEDQRKYEESLRSVRDQRGHSTSSNDLEAKSDHDPNTKTSTSSTSSTRSRSTESSRESSINEVYGLSVASKNSMTPPETLGFPTMDSTWLLTPEITSKPDQFTVDHRLQQPEIQKAVIETSRRFLPIPIFGSQLGDSVSSGLPPQEFSKLVSTLETYSKFLAEPLTLMCNSPPRVMGSKRTVLQQCFENHAFDELILFTIRLSHLGHTTAISYRPENVPVCVRAKAKALAQIQQHVSVTTEMPPNALLGSIMFLLSFEIIRGGESVAIHLEGLARLVSMRGGLAGLPDPPYALVPGLIACDLTLAATTPRMTPTFMEMTPPRLTAPQRYDSKTLDFYQSSPLMRFEDFQGVRRLYKGVPDVFTDILEDAFDGTKRVLGADDIWPKLSPGEAGMDWTAEYETGTHDFRDARVELPFVVAEACSVAGTIYYRATRRRIPFEDPVNLDDSKRLGAFLNSASLDVWRGIPYIYLWVILTGAAAAQGHPERQYLLARLIQFGFSVGLEQAEDFKPANNNISSTVTASAPQAISRRLRSQPAPPSLEHFIQRQRVLSLWRTILRSVYKIPADRRNETVSYARREFERNKGVSDLGQIRYLISTGKTEFDGMRRYIDELAAR